MVKVETMDKVWTVRHSHWFKRWLLTFICYHQKGITKVLKLSSWLDQWMQEYFKWRSYHFFNIKRTSYFKIYILISHYSQISIHIQHYLFNNILMFSPHKLVFSEEYCYGDFQNSIIPGGSYFQALCLVIIFRMFGTSISSSCQLKPEKNSRHCLPFNRFCVFRFSIQIYCPLSQWFSNLFQSWPPLKKKFS